MSQIKLSERSIKFVDAKIKEMSVEVSREMMVNGLIGQMINEELEAAEALEAEGREYEEEQRAGAGRFN